MVSTYVLKDWGSISRRELISLFSIVSWPALERKAENLTAIYEPIV
jgi:hypothetical protein